MTQVGVTLSTPVLKSEPTRARRAAARRALTLMEVVAVTAVLGLLAAMALPYFGHSTLANAKARGFARRLSIDLLQAQRRAISTGDNHLLKLTKLGSDVTHYALYRRQSGSEILVDSVVAVPEGVTVTTVSNDLEFAFTGEALATYSLTISSADRNYSVVCTPATGKPIVTEF